MKTLSIFVAALFLVFGVAVSRAAVTTGEDHVLNRISNETGVPVATLQMQKSTTGLGNGDLEHANLLANASGQSFDTIVGKFQAGEGWGKIAHDYGLKLGKIVSAAHRSDQATLHSQTVHGNSGVHGNSANHRGNPHATIANGVGHGPSGKLNRGPKMNHGHGP
jgi:hypothetical protein